MYILFRFCPILNTSKPIRKFLTNGNSTINFIIISEQSKQAQLLAELNQSLKRPETGQISLLPEFAETINPRSPVQVKVDVGVLKSWGG
jgi:hypothetical protein